MITTVANGVGSRPRLEGADLIDPAFQTESAWIPYTGILTVLIVNTDQLQPDEYPKTWVDLGDPRFEGKISSARADKSGSSYIQLATVLNVESRLNWRKVRWE